MVRSQARGKRKETGKKYIAYRKEKKFELAGIPTYTKIGKRVVRRRRGLGGNYWDNILSDTEVNLFNPKTKKCEKATIKTVLKNPANRHFVRRNIITKGTVVDTDKGKARITSRPGQVGMLNAVLIS